METTKKYFENFWGKILPFIITPIATITLATVFGGGTMIDFYCSSKNMFFGIHLSDPMFCSYLVVLGYILITILSLFLLGLLVSVIIDSSMWILGKRKTSDGKAYLPRFKSKKLNQSEIIISNSNSDNVASFFLQYLQGFRSLKKENELSFVVDETKYYNPKKYNTINHVFAINGKKLKTKHLENETTLYSMTEMLEMFFITIVQSGENIVQVKIENDDTEIFPLIINEMRNELKKIYSIKGNIRKSNIF